MADRELGAGAWSYFGDPRAISHDGHTFTGWISTTGNVWVARYTKGGKLSKQLIFRGLGRDDHNNPSLVFRRDGHIMVFFSPALGPPPAAEGHPERDALPDRRCSRGRSPSSGRCTPSTPTSPAASATRIRTRSSCATSCGCSGAAGTGTRPSPTPRTASTGRPRASSCRFGHEQRPYAKYVGDAEHRIHGIFTDGHPSSWKNSLHYARYEGGNLYAVGGRKLGSLDDVPLHTSKLDHIYHYSDAGGRAWGHDIALTPEGRPRVVYTRRVENRDTFYYALARRHALGQPQDRRGRRRAPVVSRQAARRSTTRTRASSTSRARSAAGTRSSSGSRPTRAAHGTHGG